MYAIVIASEAKQSMYQRMKEAWIASSLSPMCKRFTFVARNDGQNMAR